MLRCLFRISLLASLTLLALSGMHPSWAATDEEIEAEIAAMDEQTKRQLVREVMAGKPLSPRDEVRKPSAAPIAPKPEDSDLHELRALKSDAGQHESTVAIVRQQDNHELITTGDLIYFPTPTFKVIQPEERYPVYRTVSIRRPGENAGTYAGFEQIGKVKILEIQGKLTLACVLVANDVIRPGDAIMISGH